MSPDSRSRRTGGPRLVPALVVLAAVAVVVVVAVVLVVGGGGDEPPEPGSPEELALGDEVFVANCQTCHGQRAGGGLTGPPLTHEIYRDLEDQDFRDAIANGVPQTHWEFAPMIPLPHLDDHEIEAVIGYVRAQQAEAWGQERP